ncbi:hypothetical protein [Hymenobacter amundsenii]|uniref:hypothetical protein n=1 Tax=Hymenobacter amundsenii TaxID=2006685 RepID=UPI000F842332|nr:hypothetical protein [Hymenobacter amundsenii]
MEIKQGPILKNESGLTKYYFLIPDFDTENQDHWNKIRGVGKGLPWQNSEATIVGFLQLNQHYELSPTGEDIGLPYHAVAIAQYVRTIHGKEMFFSDPFGSGNYNEPMPKGNEFEA